MARALLFFALAFIGVALLTAANPPNHAVMTGPQAQRAQGAKTFEDLTAEKLTMPGVKGALKADADGEVSGGPYYPVFHIYLPPGFTDFELKATTDNYETMVFFYHSPDPAKAFIPSQIWSTRPDVFFTDSQRADRRQWIRQSASQSIAAMRVNGSSEIGGVILVVKDVGGAISQDNPKLIWTYAVMTPTGTEDDPGGRSIWRPIVPVWMSQPFNP
ncbi:MAG TPA: hypothetical protein VNQ90_17670 [Chthoniobacteraceae bacterium]|nr:hypothetical protein [Chthoniobacteraceae bacterium]